MNRVAHYYKPLGGRLTIELAFLYGYGNIFIFALRGSNNNNS